MLVNATPIRKTGYTVGPRDVITIRIPAPVPSSTTPENIPLDIVYEDEALLVVNKPSGMVVHPACGHRTATLVNALLYHCAQLSGVGEASRPGVVHRLDKDTSGLLVVAKQDDVHLALADQMAARRITRQYFAIVWGTPKSPAGTISAPIGRHPVHRKRMAVVETGRTATTHYQVTETLGFCSVMSLRLETGRTHQIRVHLAHHNHPVFGDATYGGRVKHIGRLAQPDRRLARAVLDILPRQALHAAVLKFRHPRTERMIECHAPIPDDMNAALDCLRNQE